MTIDEQLRVCDAASEGPWVTDPEVDLVVYCHDGGVAVVRSPALYMDGDEENLEFIVAARDRLPAALRALKRIREMADAESPHVMNGIRHAIDAFERGEA